MFHDVDMIPMGYMKSDPTSSTADETEWNTKFPDMYNILVTQHLDDGSGEVNVLYDVDFPPEAHQYAESNYHMMVMMAHYADHHQIPFGTVVNKWNKPSEPKSDVTNHPSDGSG
jgi:hypothetical protein